jgi:hypothetical protein
MTTVTLTRTERDGIRDYVGGILEADDLAHNVRDGRADLVKEAVAQYPICIRVLDQIGWEQTGDRDSYEIEADAEVVALMEKVGEAAIRTLQDDWGDDELDSCQRTILHDQHALQGAWRLRLAVA